MRDQEPLSGMRSAKMWEEEQFEGDEESQSHSLLLL